MKIHANPNGLDSPRVMAFPRNANTSQTTKSWVWVMAFVCGWLLGPMAWNLAHAESSEAKAKRPQAPPEFRSERTKRRKVRRKRKRRRYIRRKTRRKNALKGRLLRNYRRIRHAKNSPKSRQQQRLQRQMLRKIRRIRYNYTRIPYPVVQYYLQNMHQLASQTTVVPHTQDGHPVGFRIAYLTRSAAVRRLGFRKNDVVTEVNGYSLRTTAQAMLAYFALMQQRTFHVSVLRYGRRQTIRIDVQ